MAELDFAAFDADNHYYEAEDAFTRHIERRMARRAMQWADVNGRKTLLVGGKVNRFIPNPTFDPVAKPGCLDEYFRGRNPERKDIRTLFGQLDPIHPSYRDRDERIRLLDQQNLEGCFLFPTLGVGMEESLKHDPQAAVAAFRGFKKNKKTVFGYGASTKGNVLLQFCGLSAKDIPMIAEVNEDKFGCVTPGSRIPIVAEAEARAKKPDYFMVLPWHFKEGIVRREQAYLQSGGKLLLPLPKIEVISA